MAEPTDPRESANSAILDLFDVLIPPASVTIRDALGHEYLLPGALPARRQVAVIRAVERLKDVATSQEGEAALAQLLDRSQSTGQDPGDLVLRLAAVITAFAANPEVLAILDEVFEAAHPDVIKRARTEAINRGNYDAKVANATDLFAIEEIVAGFLPFLLRLAKRVGQALATLPTRPASPEKPRDPTSN